VLTPQDATKQERKAAVMLVEEIAVRTQIRPLIMHSPPTEVAPLIVVGTGEGLKTLNPNSKIPAPAGIEGFHIWIDDSGPAPLVFVVGDDVRGVVFGVGKLLRTMRMSRQKIELPGNTKIDSAPKVGLRGHQLGYRPKANSYDAWTVAMWDQYIRDLSTFGCNAIELIPPRSDDRADSPHFPLPQMQMMAEMSRICDDYAMDVWIWYPALDKDYSDAKTVEAALKEWGDVFVRLPRVDAIFVPGGDPGHTPPKVMFALLEKQAENVKRFHPKAEMWMSPQGFNKQWMEEFFELMKAEPAWLTGIVYGPQIRLPLAEVRERTPNKYPIRHYPDITHTQHCQYPVPQWDPAFALTLDREPINPRPMQQKQIYKVTAPHTIGFITYSEGCNDDVNKMIWSALGWDENVDVNEVLVEFGRYFIGAQVADDFAKGLAGLEKNWIGPLESNESVGQTLVLFKEMDKKATPQMKLSWRYQQAQYRAHYDAYIQQRLNYEKKLENDALEQLRKAGDGGAVSAVERAEAILELGVNERPAPEIRARVFELAEALYQSIRMQLSVERYRGASGRGTDLDYIDAPLNNRAWLKERFRLIRELKEEPDRMTLINEVLNWTNPGDGGFYDDLGNEGKQPHLVRGDGWENDPAFYRSSMNRVEDRFSGDAPLPVSWWTTAGQLFDEPLRMKYAGLDKEASYKLRIVYGKTSDNTVMRLVANEKTEIHPAMKKEAEPLEFEIPKEATSSGDLVLAWYPEIGRGGNGRRVNVAEVWLIKK
jgi:hypothetical protein